MVSGGEQWVSERHAGNGGEGSAAGETRKSMISGFRRRLDDLEVLF